MADADLSGLEITGAGLEEAFLALTSSSPVRVSATVMAGGLGPEALAKGAHR